MEESEDSLLATRQLTERSLFDRQGEGNILRSQPILSVGRIPASV